MSSDLIYQWVSQAFKNYKTVKVEISGTTEKGDGYIGNIAFVKAILEDENGENTTRDLVIKYGKNDKKLRKELPIRLSFEREIFVYSRVIKVFQSLDTGIMNQLITPCFATILSDQEEVLVLQNLKSIGYELHDKNKTMDLNHLTITLQSYGKFHAFSFALKHLKPEQFSELFNGLECLRSTWLCQLHDFYLKIQDTLYEILDKSGEQELLRRLKERFVRSFPETAMKLLRMENNEMVLLHGDCWNNNFMFKYQDSLPISCKFLDFQISKLASPVLDLSYHLFSTASDKELQNFHQLMKIYHQSLCQTLKHLNTDEVFSYDDLISHWKKYSVLGYIISCMLLLVSSADKENVLDIGDVKSDNIDDFFVNLGKPTIKLSNRIVSITKHFLKLEL